MADPITAYLNTLKQALQAGMATEHTHRSTLEALVEALAPGVHAVNEPKRIACGAPDLAILKQGLMVGHIEAKDVGLPLDPIERSPQLQRYRQALDNLILTDYLEFRWYVRGDLRRTATLGRWDGSKLKAEKQGAENVAQLLADFLAHTPEPITTPRELAERMARLAHLIREIIVTAFESDQASDLLKSWRTAFAEILVADLNQPENVGQFADMFAQTLAYGLFSARVMDETPGFTRQEAQRLIPKTNPFLRKFFFYITGPELDDEPYAGFVEDLVQLLAQTDMEAILADFGKRTKQEDPVVHFYETFLSAYDPALRERRGVYYTPTPVVSYIVRSVDALLKTRFGLPQGLADTTKITIKNTDPGLRVKGKESEVRKTVEVPKVLILDPATGTGTFPYMIIDFIREQFMQGGNAGMWSGYVREHLLPRLFGFELLMAPYAVAHFKLALQLAGHDLPESQRRAWAYDFAQDERVRVYLTNALEGPHEYTGLPLFTQFVADETSAANKIKRDLPIMVVLGNPPYSGHSANKGPWISDLLRGKLPNGGKTGSYYEVDGQPLGERNPKWLQDDYVKFIRFGQWRVEQSGGGILAFISNNGYLDNPTFRGMRQSLMETFTEIYILDLHGNTRKKEVAPDGSPDENVFDIMQGVAIGIFVKEPGKKGPAKVLHADLWGKREQKYRQLLETEVNKAIKWMELAPRPPFYLFIPQDIDLLAEYQQGSKITEIFPTNSVGIVTARDNLTIQNSPEDVWRIVQDFAHLEVEAARDKYQLGKDARDWKVQMAQQDLIESGLTAKGIHPIVYRPFDFRYTYYTGKTRGFICMPRNEVMQHMLNPNLGLIFMRQVALQDTYTHFGITNRIVDNRAFYSNKGIMSLAPLYLYLEPNAATLFESAELSPWPPDPDHGNRVPNLAPEFVKALEERLKMRFRPHPPAGDEGFTPEDILAYSYAIFHSPTYRERYAEFLKIDFPRVPLTSDRELFRQLVTLGRDLIALHLLESPQVGHLCTHYPVPGDNRVEKGYPRYVAPGQAVDEAGTPLTAGRVYLNARQYVEGVPPEVWEFQIGGYQVLDKWLKDRRGRALTYDELTHYQRVVVALRETLRLMAEIDAAIEEHGGWPVE